MIHIRPEGGTIDPNRPFFFNELAVAESSGDIGIDGRTATDRTASAVSANAFAALFAIWLASQWGDALEMKN